MLRTKERGITISKQTLVITKIEKIGTNFYTQYFPETRLDQVGTIKEETEKEIGSQAMTA